MPSYLPKVITTNDYNKYARNNVTKTYKRTTYYKSKLLAEKLAIDDRIAKIGETEAYITVKNLKEGIPHNFSFRLMNSI